MKMWRQHFLIAVLLAFLGGLLIAFSFPRFDLGFLSWFGLVPLLIMSRFFSPKQAFFAGWIGGGVSYLLTVYWLAPVMSHYGKLPQIVGILIMLVLASYLAAYWAFFSLLFSFISRRVGDKVFFVAPFIWVGFEYLRNYIVTGFPWILLAHSQYRFLSLIQISDIFGAYGVSFILVLVNSVLAFSLLKRFRGRGSLMALVLVALLVIIVLVYGEIRLKTVFPSGEKLKVALVQGDAEQDKLLTGAHVEELARVHLSLTDRAARLGAELIIWPESNIPLNFTASTVFNRFMREQAESHGVFLLFGSVDEQVEDGMIRYYNSAFLLNPSGEMVGKYDKVHLVPFGEYVPQKRLFFFAGKLTAGISDFSPGKSLILLKVKEHRFGVPICFEIIFPNLVRSFVQEGAEFIATITNDAWFGRTSAPYQHFVTAVFRAVECRRFVVRAANTGISGIIDPYGRIVEQTPIFEEALVVGDIAPLTYATIYVRWGDILPLVSLFVVSLVFIHSLKKSREEEDVD
jgi:apolipoprotein N-acyltransferase